MIKAKYIIPNCNHVFLIDDSPENHDDSSKSQSRKQYFEETFLKRNWIKSKDIKNWKIKIISYWNFVWTLEKYHPKPFVIPKYELCLDLLSINLVKYDSYQEKYLYFIPKEDIIEVFI